ncbi:hypothetical protein ACH429_20995 [Streptomyces pathocidini]|uniref:XRE family transcriptional regulator n=1 Tax=Streptomyces pathocidini TaxID=1650571 RepID=A0ABW7UZ01_9ACTN
MGRTSSASGDPSCGAGERVRSGAEREREHELERVLRTGPFPLALRTALTVRGLALQRVQHRLAQRGVKVGVTSLSYWQQGARRPRRPESLRAVRVLEDVLDLPDRALSRLLEPGFTGSTGSIGSTGSGDGREEAGRPAARSYRLLLDPAEALEQLLAELETPADGGLHTVGHHERVRIGPARELRARDSQQVVRAHRDGVDRYLAIHHGDPGCAPERVAVRATENCRVGRVRWHGPSGVIVAELLFDARLRTGETYVFGYGFEDGTGGPSGEYVRGFSFAGGQYVLQVRFDEAALPVRFRRFARAAVGARRTGMRELTLNGPHRSVHAVEQSVRPGILGIGWDWA